MGRKPARSVVLCAILAIRTTEERTPRSARSITAVSTTLRTRRVPLCSSPQGKAGAPLGGGGPEVPGRAYAPRRDQRLSGSRERLAVREHDRQLRGGHGVHPAKRKQVLPVRDVDDT